MFKLCGKAISRPPCICKLTFPKILILRNTMTSISPTFWVEDTTLNFGSSYFAVYSQSDWRTNPPSAIVRRSKNFCILYSIRLLNGTPCISICLFLVYCGFQQYMLRWSRHYLFALKVSEILQLTHNFFCKIQD